MVTVTVTVSASVRVRVRSVLFYDSVFFSSRTQTHDPF
jgi:hypothetical protein